jgi:hypothetical protein
MRCSQMVDLVSPTDSFHSVSVIEHTQAVVYRKLHWQLHTFTWSN